MRVLIGNSFPMTLIRGHRVEVVEIELAELKKILEGREVTSFWGHDNTREAAETALGVSLEPSASRPVMMLSGGGYPVLEGEEYRECYLLSPEYVKAFRPAIGTEVEADEITAWHALRLRWMD